MIKHVSFKHGWFYYYRVHLDKIKKCDEQMSKYLIDMFDKCPHEYFEVLPRSSSLRFNHSVELQHIRGHEVSHLAKLAHQSLSGRYKAAHSRVEVFMLENDDKTLAVEVPLWLMPDEADFYNRLFNTNNPLTGHIDILRKEGDMIYVWDYKPGAKKERYAAVQVLFYSYMLSKRTGIPFNKFVCGYFDEEDAYVFKPKKELFERMNL